MHSKGFLQVVQIGNWGAFHSVYTSLLHGSQIHEWLHTAPGFLDTYYE